MPGSSEYDASGGVQDPAAAGPRGPGPHDQIPPNKPPWFDQPHPVAPWGQQQVFSQTCGGGGPSPVWISGLVVARWGNGGSAAGPGLGGWRRQTSPIFLRGGGGAGQSGLHTRPGADHPALLGTSAPLFL